MLTVEPLYLSAWTVDPGSYVRVAGRDPRDGLTQALSGVVDQAIYMSRWIDGVEQCGVHLHITPPQRDGHPAGSRQVFVVELARVPVLPAPVDHGMPDWLSTDAVNRGGSASAVGDGSAAISVAPTAARRTGPMRDRNR